MGNLSVPKQECITHTRLKLFPITTQIITTNGISELTIAGQSLSQLADRYGTPFYLYYQATLDYNLSTYQHSLSKYYPGDHQITYAGKAFLCLAMAQWVERHGACLDCSSAGELYIASQAGLPRERIISHGVNKSDVDLLAAIQYAGILVVDNLNELQRLIQHSQQRVEPGQVPFPKIWLRLRPGISVPSHSHVQTGQVDSKFGLSPQEFLQAVQSCLTHGLPLDGLHFHLGSQLHSPEPINSAMEIALDLIKGCQNQTGWLPAVFCPGGGCGVPYHEADLPYMPLENFIQSIVEKLISGCQARQLPNIRLQLEPGRSLVARAGVAVYRIGSVKHTGSRSYLLVDGGLADNPRPALYQARYSALAVRQPLRPAVNPAWVAGPYCESGDILLTDLPMPELLPGELIAVPTSGAYQLSMSSNYNGATRPATIWLKDKQDYLIQSRETAADLLRRDLLLPSSVL